MPQIAITYNPYANSHLTLDANATPPPEQAIGYTVFDKVASISNGHGEARIVYGIDHQRVAMKADLQEHSKDKVYFMEGSYTKTERLPVYRELCYIATPAGQVLLHEKQGDSSQWLFLTTDHLGSPQHIINEQGELLQTLSFVPYGKRRSPTNWLPYTASTIQPNYIIDRGFTGHEHFDALGFINMTGRIYGPELGRFLSPDPYVQMPDYSQNFNRYSYCLNNPLKYTDPDGEFIFTLSALIAAPFTGGTSLALLPYTIGADIGMWQGGSLANGTTNPFDWDYSSSKTWSYMSAGAVVGAASGGAANAVVTSGMMGANTAAIVTGSYINSLGTSIYTGGRTDVSVSFGVASYNFDKKEWGHLGRKGNSVMQNIGYGLGGLGNVSDILAGANPGEVQLNTEHSDAIGHSALTQVGETDSHNSLVSVGPAPGGKWIFNPFKFKNGTNNWSNYVNAGKDVWKVGIKGANLKRIANYGANLNKSVNYNLYFSSCVNHTARALTLAGVPAIGIHPFILHSQMALRSVGFRPMLYSYYLNR